MRMEKREMGFVVSVGLYALNIYLKPESRKAKWVFVSWHYWWLSLPRIPLMIHFYKLPF